jgi:hypothetical protein
MERNGVSYVECKRAACPFMHLIVAGDPRQWAEWTHPGQPRAECSLPLAAQHPVGCRHRPVPVSPFVRRALARELPGKVVSR